MTKIIMAILKIPRISSTNRLSITPEKSEIIYDIDDNKIYS
jgi:hypothetical protein